MVPAMRRPGSAIRALALFCLTSSSLWSAGEAYAKECDNPLVNTCINSDTFWPNAGPMRFATVNGTETVGQGLVSFGLLSTYQSRPILLQVASPGPGGSEQYVVNHQITGNFLFGYGVTDRLQLDFALPVTFIQTGAGVSPLSGGEDLRDTAVRDLRFGFAYALVPRLRISPSEAAARGGVGNLWSLAARMTLSAPTGDRDQFAGERTAVFAPNVAGDLRVDRFFAGIDLGARLRPIAEFAGARVGSQLTTGLGVGVDVLPRELLSITAEARGYVNFAEQHDTALSAFATTSRANGKIIVPAEWMLAARSAPILAGDVTFFAGGGGPIPTGDGAITVPRFRFLLGATYAPTARDTDADGVPDRLDYCPTEPGRRGGERSGCPIVTEENMK